MYETVSFHTCHGQLNDVLEEDGFRDINNQLKHTNYANSESELIQISLKNNEFINDIL